MNEIKTYASKEFGKIRTVQLNNEIYFAGKDVAVILGYTNPRDAISKHVDDEDKGVAKCDTLGGAQDLTVINESGLYALIFGSKLESAKRFKHWVTSEVIPSIRKNGGYISGQETLSDDELLAKALMVAQNKIAQREAEIQELRTSVHQLDAVITDMTPKADYADRILSSTDCLTVSQIAQDYGMSAKSFNKALHAAGIQHKVGEQWILYAQHQGKGYVQNRTHPYEKSNGNVGTKVYTVWSQKGRMFIYEKLKEIGVFPVMEVQGA